MELTMQETTIHDALISTLKAQQSPITAGDSMAEAGRKALLKQLIQMLKYEDGSRTGDDIEDVHGMRVAIRRMRSALRLLDSYFKPKSIDDHKQSLRKIATTLGAVRDLDVLIADLEAYAGAASSDAIGGVIATIDAERVLARRALNRVFNKGSYARFVRDYADFLMTAGKGVRPLAGDDPYPVQVRYVLPTLIFQHLGVVRAYETVLADAEMTTLHMLRIECKRLRYLVSLFDEVLGTGVDEFVNSLRMLQDHLGRMNDIDVALGRVASLIASTSDADAQTALTAYRTTIADEGVALRAALPDVWRQFNVKKTYKPLVSAIVGL